MSTLPLVPIPNVITTVGAKLDATEFQLRVCALEPGADEAVAVPAGAWPAIVSKYLAPSGISIVETNAADPNGKTDELPELLLQIDPLFDVGYEPTQNVAIRSEAYEIVIDDDDNIAIVAATPQGLTNGLATLQQLALNGRVRELQILDKPRYPWRGLSLDIARHWYGVAALYQIVDIVAAYKLNILHLHLTDDQGWRIEIPDYPALTAISGKTQVNGDIAADEVGYLTLAEYQKLQQYAGQFNVTIVPEIDLPGHIHAALHAIPELNPDGIAPPAYYGVEVGMSQLRLANPATKPFIETVLTTLCANTLGDWVHIGGDEVPDLPVPEYRELVAYARDVVVAAGKRPVAWQDAADIPGLRIQYWNHRDDSDATRNASQRGEQLIMSPADRAYLEKHDANDPLGGDWGGGLLPISLAQARNWEPELVVDGADPETLVGVEAAIWSETLASFDDLLTLLFPRLPALAEVAWTSIPNSGSSFAQRLQGHRALWEYHGVPEIAHTRLNELSGS